MKRHTESTVAAIGTVTTKDLPTAPGKTFAYWAVTKIAGQNAYVTNVVYKVREDVAEYVTIIEFLAKSVVEFSEPIEVNVIHHLD